MDKIKLSVSYLGQHFDVVACRDIPMIFEECFKPIDICDDRFFRAVSGGVSREEAKIIMKTREDAADILAKEISEFIVSAMKKNDTENGYKNEG